MFPLKFERKTILFVKTILSGTLQHHDNALFAEIKEGVSSCEEALGEDRAFPLRVSGRGSVSWLRAVSQLALHTSASSRWGGTADTLNIYPDFVLM